MPGPWSEEEIKAIVKDYFTMLRAEIEGRDYNKAEHRRGLLPRLNSRSNGSIERKHQNISAVMIEMGLPYIDGYKPLANYQKKLFPEIIENMIAEDRRLLEMIEEDVQAGSDVPSVDDILGILDDPPQPVAVNSREVSMAKSKYSVGTNYLAREASNSALGAAGELLIMNYEKTRLIHADRANLADRIEQVSKTRGDREGFDILSFERSGEDRYIEVKTTRYGKETPFFLSLNEKEFSQRYSREYYLYRLFRFRKAPGLYTLKGSLESNFDLVPVSFRADGVRDE